MEPELDDDSEDEPEEAEPEDEDSEELDPELDSEDENDPEDDEPELDDDSDELEPEELEEPVQERTLTSRFQASQVQARLESHAPGRGITVMLPASSNWGWTTPVGARTAATRPRRPARRMRRRFEILATVALMFAGKLSRPGRGVNHLVWINWQYSK